MQQTKMAWTGCTVITGQYTCILARVMLYQSLQDEWSQNTALLVLLQIPGHHLECLVPKVVVFAVPSPKKHLSCKLHCTLTEGPLLWKASTIAESL